MPSTGPIIHKNSSPTPSPVALFLARWPICDIFFRGPLRRICPAVPLYALDYDSENSSTPFASRRPKERTLGKIGAAARAMKTLGMSRLQLVPPNGFLFAEATARAAGADHVLHLHNAAIRNNFQSAITPLRIGGWHHGAVGLSAGGRTNVPQASSRGAPGPVPWWFSAVKARAAAVARWSGVTRWRLFPPIFPVCR